MPINAPLGSAGTLEVVFFVVLVVALIAAGVHRSRQQRAERERWAEQFQQRNARQDAALARQPLPAASWTTPAPAQAGALIEQVQATEVTDNEDIASRASVEKTNGQGLAVEAAAALPTFADVGGMSELKTELADTLGLLARDPEGAETYGVRWSGLLLHGAPGVGKTFLARAAAGEFGCHLVHVSTGDLVEGVAGASARNVEQAFALAAANRPCVLVFDEFDSIAARRNAGTHPEERRTVNQLLTSLEAYRTYRDLIVVATTNDVDHLDPAVIRPGRFDHHVRIDLPDRAARRAVLVAALTGRPACDATDLDDLAGRTEGLTPAALVGIVDAAAMAAFRAASGSGELVRITGAHLDAALAERGGRDRPTVEDWEWDDLVLPADVRQELEQLQALVENPELIEHYGVDPPSGVLLAGPPGTGKTTVARILAAQARCSFYPVSAADVTSKWVGESEQRIQRLFARARANRPSIVFIDELDALGAHRGARASDEAGARLVNQLLVEIDGLGSQQGLLVVGATNRPELLDAALTRGGRLSRTITLGLPDAAGRRAILEAATARMPTLGLDLDRLAAVTDGRSPADLKAICQQAALRALVRARERDGDEHAQAVAAEDFNSALADLTAPDQQGERLTAAPGQR